MSGRTNPWRQRWSTRSIVSVSVLSLVTASLVVAAVRSDGYHATKVELDDASVWVFNTQTNYVGRLNSQTRELDSAVRTKADLTQTELWQLGRSVTLGLQNATQRLDPVLVKLERSNDKVGGGNIVRDAGGGASIIIDRELGVAWVGQDSNLATFDPEADGPGSVVSTTEGAESAASGTTGPLISGLSPRAIAAVSSQGDVVVVDPDTDQFYVARLDRNQVAHSSPGRSLELGFDLPSQGLTLTAVGDVPVLMFGSQLAWPGLEAPVDISDAGLVLQQPGPSSSSVFLAGSSGLWKVSLDDGVAQSIAAGGGRPARPVFLGGCVHAAWAGSRTYVQQCGSGAAHASDLGSTVGTSEHLVFRVNGRVIALNGDNGSVFLVTGEEVTRVDNWDEVQEQDDSTVPPEANPEPAECDLGNNVDPELDPEAPEAFGVHPGETIRIPLLDFFRDANCDALVITEMPDWNAARDGTLSLIDHRQTFQFQAPIGAAERQLTIPYTVDDGNGGTADGEVYVNVVSGSGTYPRPLRESQTVVEAGKKVEYNVLVDLIDDDGDAISIVDVNTHGNGSAEYDLSGTVRFDSRGVAPGLIKVDVAVQDVAGNPWTQPLIVDVKPAGTPLPPTARNDYASGTVDSDVVIQPLVNDTDPNNDQLILAQVHVEDDDLQVVSVSQGDNGELRLRANTAGDYRITYVASDGGPKGAPAVIRFNAVASAENTPPLAVTDKVMLPRGNTLNVAVLGNDFDADGDLLVVTDAVLDDLSIPEVEVVVVNGEFVRITANSVPMPTRPIPITYGVSDGVNDVVRAQVLVQVTEPTDNMPPEVVEDRAVVRAGDVVTIDVLANDSDPDGDPLLVVDTEIESSDIGGQAWISGNKVRFLAGEQPGRVYLSYEVDDSPLRDGLRSRSAQIQIDVTADTDDNSPPQAIPLEARVYSGGRATVVVPVDGVDPDGDSVQLLGFGPISDEGSSAAKGTVTIVDGNFVYQAWPDSEGADTFTYQLIDAKGARSAPAVVSVAIVKSPNHSPLAARDEITVRPGRTLQIPVLANDTDPDGDELEIVEDELIAQPGSSIEGLGWDETRVRLTVPVEGDYVARYKIRDGRGGSSYGVIIVHADPKAPLVPPTLRDDFAVTAADHPGSVAVKIFDNDDDPDNGRTEDSNGNRSDIVLKSLQPAGAGEFSNDVLTVAQTAAPQHLLYTVVDADKNEASALVVVPALGDALPRLKDPQPTISVPVGASVDLELSDFVTDPDSPEAVRLFGSRLVAVGGTAEYIEGEPMKLRFTADPFTTPEAFRSRGKVSFEVTDDSSDPADQRRVVRLELEVTITYDGDLPIRTNPVEVSIEKASTPDPVDLLDEGYVKDPNDGVPTFGQLTTVDKEDGDIAEVTLSPEGVLTVVPQGEPEAGSTAEYSYVVTHGTVSAVGTIRVVAVPSTRPEPTASNFTRRVKQNETDVFDVSAGAVNSFAPDHPLHLVEVAGPPADQAWGQVSYPFDTGDTSITFTPDPDFAGTVVVRYVIADYADVPPDSGTASSAADARRATGTITYNVVGRPLTPPAPTVLEVRSHTVVLNVGSDDPDFWQGTKIGADYIVKWPGGQQSTDGKTLVTIENLPNDVPVQFTVTAKNEVGLGDESPPSIEVRPDQVPDKPNPPRIIDEGIGQLTVQWDAVVPDGSPVQGYQLLISDPAVSISELPGNTTSYVVTSLQDGQNYSFALIARNRAETNGGKSEMSDWSQPGHPYRRPDAPTITSVADVPGTSGGQAEVRWSAPAFDGGDPIDYYQVKVDGAEYPQTPSAQTSQTLTVASGQHTYYVRAHNKRDWSDWTQMQFFSVQPPTAPSITSVSSPGSGQLRVVFTPSTWNNVSNSGSYEVNVGSGWSTLATSSAGGGQLQGTVSGLVNCRNYSVTVRANNGRYTTASSTYSNASPYAGPPAPGVSGSAGGNQITWNWSTSQNGDCAISSVQARVDGNLISGSASGPSTQPYGYSETHTLTVTVTDSRGGTNSASVSRTTDGPPTQVTISQGGWNAAANGSCAAGACRWVNISTTGWSAGQSLTITCYSSYGTVGPYTKTANGSGSYSTSGLCMYAPGAQNVHVIINGVSSPSMAWP